jgi:Peptidase A4 family
VTNISRATASASTALALTLTLGVIAAAVSGHRASHGASGTAASSIGLGAGPVERSVAPAVGSVDSLNSSGYAVSRRHTRFRFVQATFFVPYLTCGITKSAASFDWVGLGGFVGSSDSVEQAGVEADCSSKGRASYHAWYAMYPRGVTKAKVEIRAGDSITAGVFYDSATKAFALSVTNNTTAGHFEVHASCPHGTGCPRESAEVISSAPTASKDGHVTIKPLADYGAVSFAAIAFTSRSGERGGLRSADWTATRILETEKNSPFRTIARPTPIQADSFDSYWARAS